VDKLWLSHYQQGVPYEINLESYDSLVHLFEEACLKYKDKNAYMNYGSSLSFRALEEYSRAFAIYLQQLGLKQNDRVAIMLPNTLQYPIALFGILRAGCIVVNTNPLYTSDEVIHQMNDCKATAILVLANFASTLERSLPHIPSLKHIIVTDLGDVFPPIKRILFNGVIKYIKRLVPRFSIPHAIPFRKTIASYQNGYELSKPTLTHQDTAFIQYTGGTTGISKGAILTHGNLIANVLQASSWITPLHVTQNDIIVTALPLYHIFSLTANCLTFLRYGALNILITNPRDLKHFIRDIKHRNITAITGVNTLFNALLNHPEFHTINFSKLKLSLSGGMALQKSVSIAWQEKTKSPILEAYGLTETSPAVTINPMYLKAYNGSIGLPLPSTNVSIRDDAGHEVALGETGELCVKGPQVMPGYWQRPDETALVFWDDGFLRTGDIARIDDQGFVYLVDRKKDMIIVSGFNVYPNEVEQVISMMPGVLEVGVVGVHQGNSDEQVKACIVKRDPALSETQVIAHCRKHLTAYKVPKLISFYTELPKSNVGKILRRELK
jgi:long-chain acyl-CoA synthetase